MSQKTRDIYFPITLSASRFQCMCIWVPTLLLAEEVSSAIGSHVHFENFGLGRG